MKKMSAKITQAASKLYSDDKIQDKSLNGMHRGESFQEIANTIFNNPDIMHETDEKTGITSMKINDKMIGWYDKNRGIGNIDQDAYDKLKDARESVPVDMPVNSKQHDYDNVLPSANIPVDMPVDSKQHGYDNDLSFANKPVDSNPRNFDDNFNGDYDGDSDWDLE